VMIGAGFAQVYDISSGSTYQIQPFNSTGGSAVIDAGFPGLDYDPVNDRIVAWIGGDVVYTLDMDTRQWSSVTYPGGPQPSFNGTHGRWRYVPSMNLFVVYGLTSNDGYTFRLDNGSPMPSTSPDAGPTSADADFAARCAAPGVLKCIGFDS